MTTTSHVDRYPPPPPLLPHGIRPAHDGGSNQRSPLQVQTSANIPQCQGTSSSTETQPSETQRTSPSSSPGYNAENVDKASLNGNFGWMTLDSVNIPCLFRHNEKYVSVRMVEQKLLSKYPSTYPEELHNRAPLVSQFITEAEAKLLNEINIQHCACEFGQQAFTENDLVVSWTDFVEFHNIVKKHFPSELLVTKPSKPFTQVGTSGGWVQINNTVVPYIKRLAPSGKETLRLAPLPVIKYAANLLTNTPVPTLHSKEDECQKLTEMCKSAGLDFTFSSSSTPLVLLTMLQVYSDNTVTIKRLPDNDPFSSAEFCPELESEDDAMEGTSLGALLPTKPSTTARSATQRYVSEMDKVPPPNVTIQRSASCTLTSATNGVHQGIKSHRSPLPVGHLGPRIAPVAAAGPPAKRPRTIAPSTLAPVPLVKGAPPVRGIVQSPLFPVNFVMPPPGMVHGAHGAWRPRTDNPADMKKLADMMNMQAAILSQSTGTMAARNRLMQTSAVTMLPKSNGQNNPGNQATNTASTAIKPLNNKPVGQIDPGVKIRPIDFHGKKVSCLVKEGSKQQFALVEAVSRVYFPRCNLEEFLDAVSKVLQISVYQLNIDEEKAFIKFYGLPTESLKCNKVVNLRDLDRHMPQMKYMFAENKSTSTNQTSKPQIRSTLHNAQPVSKVALSRANNSEVGNKGNEKQTSLLSLKLELPMRSSDQLSSEEDQTAKPSVPVTQSTAAITAPTSAHESNTNTNAFGNLPQSKKTGARSRVGGLSKLSKLEDAVNRLHKNKMKELTSSPPTDSIDEPSFPDNVISVTSESARSSTTSTVNDS